jgi:ABC-2 type transport system ATP-binding protein
VTKDFGTVRAVRGIDLTIQPGEVVAFLGPNGAGKTTTLDMVLGLSGPTSGSVRIDGARPRQAVDAGRVAAVTQTGGLLNDISLRQHVRLIARLFGYGDQRVDEVLAQAGIAGLAKRRTQTCSGGEKQRLKFAMALVCNPDLIVLDEPTAGMDVQARRDFWSDIHQQARLGRTVVFATHYLEEADQYADRVVVLVRGRIVADGTTAEVRNLVSGRTVTADFDSPDQAQAAGQAVRGLATSVKLQGAQAIIRTKNSDDVVRQWLTTTAAHNVLVSSESLEDAFLSLTDKAEGGQK